MMSKNLKQIVEYLESAKVTENIGFVPIADPGDGGTLSPLVSSYCEIETTAADDVMDLDLPVFEGQTLVLMMVDDDGGDGVCTITVASALDGAGNDTITLTNVGESVTLRGLNTSGVLSWVVTGGSCSGGIYSLLS